MRVGRICALLSMSCLMVVAMAGVAWAHVVLSPKEVPANSYQKLVVSVPTEKDIPTTGVRVEVPEGFIVTGVQPVPGWQHEFEKSGGTITAITWSGGKIEPEEFQEFALQARTPKDTGDYPWKAHQTYEDGSVVDWTGPPDAEEPASVVRVGSGGSEGTNAEQAGSDHHSAQSMGAYAEETSMTTLPESGGPEVQSIAAYAGLSLGALILVVATLLIVRRHRSS